jgi:hypothetical protein
MVLKKENCFEEGGPRRGRATQREGHAARFFSHTRSRFAAMLLLGTQGGPKERAAGSMTIIHKQDKRKGGVAPVGQLAEVERAVANCLCCGKIYDCRLKSSDVQTFLGEPIGSFLWSRACTKGGD